MAPARSPADLDALLQHADWIHRLALRLCADEHAAADAVQETWTQALRRPPVHADNLRGWLAQLLRRCVGMRARGERRRAVRESASHDANAFAEAAAEAVARADLHRHLAELVQALPEPQRTLVLLHYFEGCEVDALARRLSLSADAVRGHLRRARATLRERLHRSDDRTQRAFAALLATTIPTLAMTITTKTMLGLGAVAAALLLYAAWPSPPPAVPTTAPRDANVQPIVADAGAASADRAQREVAARERSDVTPAPARTWTVRLDGLRDDAPWTAKVHVDVEGKDAAGWQRADHADLPHGGTLSVPRPAWWDRASLLKVRVRAEDPNYLPFDETLRDDDDALHARDEFVQAVQVVGVLTGRVVDEHGAPVPAARIVAFARDEGSAPLGQTNSGADGSYTLQTPPNAPLLVTATAMHEASLSGMRMVTTHGAITDDGRLRHDLLPASVATAARAGVPTKVDDLVLRAAAQVTGRVMFTDGSPVAKAQVFLYPPSGNRSLALDDDLGLQRHDDGTLNPVGGMRTDADGRFAFACQPGASITVGIVKIEGAFLCGDSTIAQATAPGALQITVPLPIRVRARRNGQPCGDARFELRNLLRTRALDGTLNLILFDASVELRVRAGAARSRAIELRREQAGSTVDIELDEALAPIAIEFTGGKVRQVRFELTPLQGGEAFTEFQQRDDRGEPFRLFVVPGRYRLDLRAAPGENSGTYLRPQSIELEVGLNGGAWTLPAVFAGRVRLAIQDGSGLFVGGRFALRDSSGRDHSGILHAGRGAFLHQGTPGELLPGGANETADLLEPGDYDLELDLGAHGIERRRVTVRAGQTTEVAIRVR